MIILQIDETSTLDNISQVLLPTFILMWILHDSGKNDKAGQLINLTLSTYPDAKIMLTNDTSYPSSLFEHTVHYIEKKKIPVLYANSQIIVESKYEQFHVQSLILNQVG